MSSNKILPVREALLNALFEGYTLCGTKNPLFEINPVIDLPAAPCSAHRRSTAGVSFKRHNFRRGHNELFIHTRTTANDPFTSTHLFYVDEQYFLRESTTAMQRRHQQNQQQLTETFRTVYNLNDMREQQQQQQQQQQQHEIEPPTIAVLTDNEKEREILVVNDGLGNLQLVARPMTYSTAVSVSASQETVTSQFTSSLLAEPFRLTSQLLSNQQPQQQDQLEEQPLVSDTKTRAMNKIVPSVIAACLYTQNNEIHVALQSSTEEEPTSTTQTTTATHGTTVKRSTPSLRTSFHISVVVFKPDQSTPDRLRYVVDRVDSIASEDFASTVFFNSAANNNNSLVIVSTTPFSKTANESATSTDATSVDEEITTSGAAETSAQQPLSAEYMKMVNERLASYTSDELMEDSNIDSSSQDLHIANWRYDSQLQQIQSSTYTYSKLLATEMDAQIPAYSVDNSGRQQQQQQQQRVCIGVAYDVDMCVFAVACTPESEVKLEHIRTFSALSYVISGKSQKKFVSFDDNANFAYITDVNRLVYAYPASLENSPPRTSKHQVIDLGGAQEVIGIQSLQQQRHTYRNEEQQQQQQHQQYKFYLLTNTNLFTCTAV